MFSLHINVLYDITTAEYTVKLENENSSNQYLCEFTAQLTFKELLNS